jgi:hypothetical protein
MTYDSDSINAFQGILARLPYFNVWGIPVALTSTGFQELNDRKYDMGFVRGLMWENPGEPYDDRWSRTKKFLHFRRLPQFPSWSWAGWAGTIRPCVAKRMTDYSSDSGCYKVDEDSFNTKFWVELKDGTRISLGELCAYAGTMGQMPELSTIVYVEATVYQVIICQHPGTNNGVPFFIGRRKEEEVKWPGIYLKFYVRMFKKLQAEPDAQGRIVQRMDAVELFQRSHSWAVFIIEWSNEIASVIAVGFLHQMDAWRAPSRRQLIPIA